MVSSQPQLPVTDRVLVNPVTLTTWPRVTTKRPSNVESLALILENNQTVHPAATGYDDMTQLDGSKTVLLSQFSRISILRQIRAAL